METKPDISVLMTVYDGEDFLDEAIESILNQTYTDFEFIIVVEKDCNENTLLKVQQYAQKDKRICLLFNDIRVGLAESLNRGMRYAKGKYVARMDDDDVSMPTRLEKQWKYMEKNPDIGVCGCLQMTITPTSEKKLLCATEPEELKAEMLFGCQLSHTSVMFRRDLFLEKQWFYDGTMLAEDFNLWLNILDETKMANLDEVLVKHRYGFNNISENKGERLKRENSNLVKNALKKYLHLDNKWLEEIYCAWRNFPKNINEEQAIHIFFENLDFLRTIDVHNRDCKFVLPEAFVVVLFRRFQFILNNVIKVLGIQEIGSAFNHFVPDKEKSFNDNMLEFVNSIFCIEDSDCINAWLKLLRLPQNKKIVIWGMGEAYRLFINNYGIDELRKNYQVLEICDSQKGERDEKAVSELMKSDEYDYVLISTGNYFYEIKEQIIRNYSVSNRKIGLLCQINFPFRKYDIDKMILDL